MFISIEPIEENSSLLTDSDFKKVVWRKYSHADAVINEYRKRNLPILPNLCLYFINQGMTSYKIMIKDYMEFSYSEENIKFIKENKEKLMSLMNKYLMLK